jgi:hypothetical protein
MTYLCSKCLKRFHRPFEIAGISDGPARMGTYYARIWLYGARLDPEARIDRPIGATRCAPEAS